MAVPDFQTLMLPALRASALNEIAVADIRKRIAGELALTLADLTELQPSGKQPQFVNRTAWAIFYLERAGLLERLKRGVYRASPAGQKVLNENPSKIDLGFLEQFPQYVEWRHKTPTTIAGAADIPVAASGAAPPTPEDQMEQGFRLITAALAQQLLERIREMPPKAFEQLVIELLLSLGYGGGRREMAELTGKPGDGGIDGKISEDALGLDVVCVQAKRYGEGHNVGRPDVQQFAGSLDGVHASKGIFITTSAFSNDAHGFVKGIGKRIMLIDGPKLASLMIEKGVGVSTSKTYVIKQIDENYFAEA